MTNYAIYTRKNRNDAKVRATYGRKPVTIAANSKREALDKAVQMLPDSWLSAEVEGDTSKRE